MVAASAEVRCRGPPQPTLVTSTVPGNLPHDLGVTKGGDAYVNIPILPAPGVAGLEPRLSIDYGGGRQRQLLDRHDPADTLGYGWRISGLSAIHRCVKNTDAGSIALGSGDALCLNGEPLVLIAGAHLTAGAEYRTYRESFARVKAKGSASALWFEALLPDGGRGEYGNTADSRLRATLASRSGDLVWSLNREEDIFDSPDGSPDNDMTITYHEDETALVRQPSEISYHRTPRIDP